MLKEGGSKLFYPFSLLSEIGKPNCINELFAVGMSFRQMKENFQLWLDLQRSKVQTHNFITAPMVRNNISRIFFVREGRENSEHCAFSD